MNYEQEIISVYMNGQFMLNPKSSLSLSCPFVHSFNLFIMYTMLYLDIFTWKDLFKKKRKSSSKCHQTSEGKLLHSHIGKIKKNKVCYSPDNYSICGKVRCVYIHLDYPGVRISSQPDPLCWSKTRKKEEKEKTQTQWTWHLWTKSYFLFDF